MRGSALTIVALFSLLAVPPAQQAIAPVATDNDAFELVLDGPGIASLKRPGDPYETEFLRRGRPLGELVVHYRAVGAERWSEALTGALSPDAVSAPATPEGATARRLEWELRPRPSPDPEAPAPRLRLAQTFLLDGDGVRWTLELENLSNTAVEIGDLGLSLDLRNVSSEDTTEIYEQNVAKHHFVSGHGSWIFWERANGVGPYLVMMPREGSWLEYFDTTDHFRAVSAWPWFYVHSGVQGPAETRGTWRQAHTAVTLAPAGEPGAGVEHGFTLRWADDYRDVRRVIYEEGLIDVTVAPAMTVPLDQVATVALRTRRRIRVEAEFPEQTEIEYLGEAEPDLHRYRVRFARTGENALIVHWDGAAGPPDVRTAPPMPADAAATTQAATASRAMVPGPTGAAWSPDRPDAPPDAPGETVGPGRPAASAADGPYMLLEFFVTEPVQTLLRKRAAHIAHRQQHRDPSKWYDGLFSVWDMRNGGVLRGPDDTDGFDGWWGYVLAADDPVLSKAPFVAAKNAVDPDAEEIAALEYYLERYVWGGLQRTDEEKPYPWGVYGVPNWRVNRESPWGFGSGGKGLEHVWRMYDYPHIVMLYLEMHRIARDRPELVRWDDAGGYLERAYQTARAYFLYPYELLPWYEIYKWGTMNEVAVLELLEALRDAGRAADAEWFRAHLDRKLKYFIYDDPYPFRSEYAFDSTGFESTHALAAWGLTDHTLEPDADLWHDVNLDRTYSHPDVSQEDVREFLERQLAANLAVRGRIEPAYYYLGSDFRQGRSERHTLNYMSQMGGWGVLEYALRFAADPEHVAWLDCRGLLDGGALPESRRILRRQDDPAAVPDCSASPPASADATRRAETRRAELLRVGVASFLAPFALMNTSPDGDGGHWYAGEANDGATGWAFTATKFGAQWIRKEGGRGPWTYDGEIDLGYGAAVRMLRLLRQAGPLRVDDPTLGEIVYDPVWESP